MNTTTVVLAAVVVFALVGILVFAAVAPYLSAAHATTARVHDDCGPNKEPPCGGGESRVHDDCGPNNDGVPPCGGNRVH